MKSPINLIYNPNGGLGETPDLTPGHRSSETVDPNPPAPPEVDPSNSELGKIN